MYYDWLAPPGLGFWVTVIFGAVFTFAPFIYKLISEQAETTWGSFKNQISFGTFSAVATLVILHLFGDQRILGWLYTNPDPNALIAPVGVFSVLLIVLVAVGILAAIRQDNGVLALFGLVASMIVFQFVTGAPIFPWLIHHWPATLGLLVANLLIGTCWAIFYKWDEVVVHNRQLYDDLRSKWLEKNGYNENTDFTLENKADWENYFECRKKNEDGTTIEFRPRYRDHKSELIGWMTLWPVSMFETFLFDFMAGLFKVIYEQIGGLLETVMIRRWKGTESHMLTAEEREIIKQREKNKS